MILTSTRSIIPLEKRGSGLFGPSALREEYLSEWRTKIQIVICKAQQLSGSTRDITMPIMIELSTTWSSVTDIAYPPFVPCVLPRTTVCLLGNSSQGVPEPKIRNHLSLLARLLDPIMRGISPLFVVVFKLWVDSPNKLKELIHTS